MARRGARRKISHTVRQTRVVDHCAVGAVVRLSDETVVPCDIRAWRDANGTPLGDRLGGTRWLQAVVGSETTLRKPPIRRRDPRTGELEGPEIPVVRFPRWMTCPRCGLMELAPWRGSEGDDAPRCRSGRCLRQSSEGREPGLTPRLVPVPFVMISPLGYLSDLPWHHLAHRDAPTAAQRDCQDRGALHLIWDEKSRGWLLRCAACRAFHDLKGIRNRNFLAKVPSMTAQPWSPEPVDLARETREEEDEVLAFAVELSDPRIHIPETITALEIPPDSRVAHDDLRLRLRHHEWFDQLWSARDNPARLKPMLRLLHSSLSGDHSLDEVTSAFAELAKGWPGDPVDSAEVTDLWVAEYRAFMTDHPDLQEWERFLTRDQTPEWRELQARAAVGSPLIRGLGRMISKLVIADRLRVIEVFNGFRRGSQEGDLVQPDLGGGERWLPAVELFGEGIFFALNEELLQDWEERPEVMRRASELGDDLATPRFVLIHTLTHLIIRELESSCGYPAASISERIYSARNDPEIPIDMAGALIYIALPDVMGSLGGLAQQGEPEPFLELLARAFERSRWCSFDPVCRENRGISGDRSKGAACHACCLLPETSCPDSNERLDRLMLRGDASTGLPGFLSFLPNAIDESGGGR